MQHGHHTGRQRNQAGGRIRLRVIDEVAHFRGVLQGAGNINGAVFPVNIRELQFADFAETKAAEQRQQNGRAVAHVRFIVQTAEKLHRLFFGEIMHTGFLGAWACDLLHGVLCEEVPLHRIIQHSAEGVIVVLHRSA